MLLFLGQKSQFFSLDNTRVMCSLVPRPSNGNEEIGWVVGEGLGNNVHLPRAVRIREM